MHKVSAARGPARREDARNRRAADGLARSLRPQTTRASERASERERERERERGREREKEGEAKGERKGERDGGWLAVLNVISSRRFSGAAAPESANYP